MSKLEELFKDFKAEMDSMSEKELFDFFDGIEENINEPEIENYINNVLLTSEVKVYGVCLFGNGITNEMNQDNYIFAA